MLRKWGSPITERKYWRIWETWVCVTQTAVDHGCTRTLPWDQGSSTEREELSCTMALRGAAPILKAAPQPTAHGPPHLKVWFWTQCGMPSLKLFGVLPFSSEGSYEEQVWWPACAQVWGSSYTGWFYREKQIKVPAFPLTSSKTQATGDSLNVNATGGCKGSGSLTAESSSSSPPSATAAMKLPDLKTRQPQAAPAPSAASLGCCHTFFSIPTKQELH